ncbi:WDR19, partial [Symbiodinium microadriaticum]
MDENRAEGHGKRDKSNIPAVQRTRFCQALALHRLEDAWQAALDINKREYWLALSGKAMEMMNVELAIRVYRQLGDAGMVMSLQKCLHVEDKHLLGGYISLFFSDYHSAQELFLLSSNPVAALDMQCDLMRWDQALKLAHNLAPDRVPYVSIKYGQQLEFRDDSDRALRLFESALNAVDNDGMGMCPEALAPVAMAGIARCNLRLGNIRQGIRLATEVGTATLYSECGDILELHKQYSEAASMFIKAGNHEKAAEIYVRHLITLDKNRLNEAIPIFQKVSNSQLNSSLAKACIAAGRFDEAAKAYERAKDFDKVVEIKLRHLDQVQQAFDLVREMASSEGATLVANYCLEVQNYRGAIEFFLMAKKSDEAFKLAQSHNQVDVYAGLLGENIPAEDALKVANFYEKAQDFGKAGKYYSLCAQYQRALKLFIQCGDREIDAAIDVVGKCQNEHLTHQLIDFLVGEKDGIPKDPNYIYRLYMALKKYDDAAKTAAIISRQEQDMGNYSLAHGVVTETIRKLEDDGIRVPSQLRSHFVLLHSYLIVKRLVKRGDHTGAARMLLRVAESVSKFPQHLVPILTSTVVECQRAGLKASSYEYAAMLMRPEYRSNIDTNLKRKIEAIVRRRSANSDDVQEELSPCPI